MSRILTVSFKCHLSSSEILDLNWDSNPDLCHVGAIKSARIIHMHYLLWILNILLIKIQVYESTYQANSNWKTLAEYSP